MQFKPFSLNVKGRIIRYERPAVMGIINLTPDSFYSESRVSRNDELRRRVAMMVSEGADMIDVGGYSSRPGAAEVSEQEELDRLCAGLATVREEAGDLPLSVDTFRAKVASEVVEHFGVDIINDISCLNADREMLPTIARLGVAYVLMHMRGTPRTMQSLTDYTDPTDPTADVVAELSSPLHRLQLAGVADVIIDPGFGFAKTLEQNYALMRHLDLLTRMLERPVLVGISRKSMITRLVGCTPQEALPGTTALHTFAALNGASLLRVHDVAAARQAVDVAMAIAEYPHHPITTP